MKQLSATEKLFFAALVVCLVSFLLPATRLQIGNQFYTQYFIGSYAGKTAFALLLIFGLALQGVSFYRLHKLQLWPAAVCGTYASLYAFSELFRCFTLFNNAATNTLAHKLQASCTPLAGIWLLLTAGITVLAIAAIKLAGLSLSQKKLPNAAS